MSDLVSDHPPATPKGYFSTPIATGFNPTIEYGRFIAACLVLSFHAGYLGALGSQLPVSFFTVILVFLGLRSRAAKPGHLSARLARLLRPWLVWTVIYGALQMLQGVLQHRSPWALLRSWLPPEGYQGQLWFLPFAALVTILIFALPARLLRDAPRSMAGPAALATVGLGAFFVLGPHPKAPLLDLFLLYTPSVALGVLFFALARSRGLVLMAAAVTAVVGIILNARGVPVMTQFALGAPLAALALCAPTVRLPAARWLGNRAMDVYLNHIFAFMLVKQFTPLSVDTPAGIVLAFAISLLGAEIVHRVPLLGRYLH